LYARQDAKTKRCVCGYTSKISRMLKVDTARDEREAGEKVRYYQEKAHGPPGFVKFH
jgi:hypothetical protein